MDNENKIALRLKCLEMAVNKVASSGLDSILATATKFEDHVLKDIKDEKQQGKKRSDNASVLE